MRNVYSNTPRARINYHLEYWADKPNSNARVLLDMLQGRIDASGRIGNKGLRLLRELDNLRDHEEWQNDPDRQRGEMQIQSASKGGKATAKWKKQSEEMQLNVDEIHRSHPDWSYERIKRKATKDNGYPASALKRYTKNPHKK